MPQRVYDPATRQYSGSAIDIHQLATDIDFSSTNPIKDYINHPAVLYLRSMKDQSIKLATDNFLLMNFNESDQEKIGTFYTMSLPAVYVGAGRQPRIYSYGGVVVDSIAGGEAISRWLYIYNRYLRGTQCIANGMVAELMFRDQFRQGYLVNTKIDYDTGRPAVAQLSFSMFIVNEDSITNGTEGSP